MRYDTEAEQRISPAPALPGISFDESSRPLWVDNRKTLAFLDRSEAAAGVYGDSRQTFLTMTVLNIQPTTDIPVLKQVHKLAIAQGAKHSGEVAIKPKQPGRFFGGGYRLGNLTLADIQPNSSSPGEGKRVIPARVGSPSKAAAISAATLRRTVSEQG